MAGPNAGRRGHRWRRLHAALKLQRRPCWLCGQPIDYGLDWPDTGSFSVDHDPPLSVYPAGAEDPAHLRPAHLGCNSSRGQKPPRPSVGQTSRNW
jgi:5-methylcytosine-specific restriction endonuclease McrA